MFRAGGGGGGNSDTAAPPQKKTARRLLSWSRGCFANRSLVNDLYDIIRYTSAVVVDTYVDGFCFFLCLDTSIAIVFAFSSRYCTTGCFWIDRSPLVSVSVSLAALLLPSWRARNGINARWRKRCRWPPQPTRSTCEQNRRTPTTISAQSSKRSAPSLRSSYDSLEAAWLAPQVLQSARLSVHGPAMRHENIFILMLSIYYDGALLLIVLSRPRALRKWWCVLV